MHSHRTVQSITRTHAKRKAPPTNVRFVPRTKMGRQMWMIRQRIIARGVPLLDWQALDGELRERRGEPVEEK